MSHFLSRYDDRNVIHNIEATSTHPGSFNSEEDSFYIEKFRLPKRAIECGSDLRKLTAREMMGLFFTSRGRHFRDTGRMRYAETDYALSRVLFPNHRWTYIESMAATIDRGADLFDRGEFGHPDSLFEDLAPRYAPNVWRSVRTGLESETPKPPPFIYHDVYLAMPRLPQPDPNGKEIRR